MTREEARERLIHLAGMVALEAPHYKGTYVKSATVSWETIEEIRTVMTAAGLDYKVARKKFERIRREGITERNAAS